MPTSTSQSPALDAQAAPDLGFLGEASACLPGLPEPIETQICRNPHCPNLGETTGHTRIPARQAGGTSTLSLRCRFCRGTARTYSNPAVAAVARASLARHWPLYTCPNPSCQNHSINLLDNPSRDAYSRYGRTASADQRFECNACAHRKAKDPNLRRQIFAVGEMAIPGAKFETCDRLLLQTMCGNGMEDMLYLGILSNPGDYAPMLRRLQGRCNFFNAFQGRKFEEAFAERELHVYTDFMNIALKRPSFSSGQQSNHLPLSVALSVLHYDRHLFLLGVTPGFMPLSQDQIPAIIQRTSSKEYPKLETEQPYAHLEISKPIKDKPARGKMQFTEIDLEGSMVRRTYTALGHFFMLRVLLRSAKRVYHYIDHADDLRVGVLTAFAKPIKANRAEVIIVSPEKMKRRLKTPQKQQVSNEVKRMREYREGELRKIRGKEGRDMFEDSFDRAKAILYRRALARCTYKKYLGLWLRRQAVGKFTKNVLRVFWVTQRENVNLETEQATYMNASIQPVDSCISAMRTNLYSAERSSTTSTGLKGYRGQPELPDRVLAALDLFRFRWNYCDPIGPSRGSRAQANAKTRAQHTGVSQRPHTNREALCTFRAPEGMFPRIKKRRRRMRGRTQVRGRT